MKDTFYRLKTAKKTALENAAIHVFGIHGFEGASLDAIVQECGISKGGLYEYISAKEDLFLHCIAVVFDGLYGFLKNRLQNSPQNGFLARFYQAAGAAADFYLERPDRIRFLVQCSRIQDHRLASQAEAVFTGHFHELFSEAAARETGLIAPAGKVLELLRWLLIKTRNEFLLEWEKAPENPDVKTNYLENWKFYLDVMKSGIYR